jgi:hypothetical protein
MSIHYGCPFTPRTTLTSSVVESAPAMTPSYKESVDFVTSYFIRAHSTSTSQNLLLRQAAVCNPNLSQPKKKSCGGCALEHRQDTHRPGYSARPCQLHRKKTNLLRNCKSSPALIQLRRTPTIPSTCY